MLADELRSLFLFDGISADALADLAEVGDVVAFHPGDVLFQQGRPAESWWVLLEGRVELHRRAGREEALAGVMERPGVWAGGFMAWTDAAPYMATGRAATPGRVLRVPAGAFGAWTRAVLPLGAHLIAGFFQTARNIEAAASQRESLVALGTLAAGLAHELNNPAAAAVRSVEALRESCDGLLSSLVQLAQGGLSAASFVALDELRRELGPSSAPEDPIEVADREEALTDWLEGHDVEEAWRIAPPLAAAGVDTDWCERAADMLDAPTLEPGLTWVANTRTTEALLQEMAEATSRVSGLVAAVKTYSQMDRASLQELDVVDGLESTLVMLGHKLRAGITVVREFAADAPHIEGDAGELNQVWTNLIDNAVDAMEGRGTLRVATRDDGEAVVVEICDSGSGMSDDVQIHAFDPFFTTKEVGKGTGLGLDISRRIVVDRHGGDIGIESRPGATVLRVRLPARRNG